MNAQLDCPVLKAYVKQLTTNRSNHSERLPFNGGGIIGDGFGDPWIEWHLAKNYTYEKISRIIVLQDWGCKNEDGECRLAAEQVNDFLDKANENTAIGLNKIFKCATMNKRAAQIIPPSTFILNAVWGLRPGGKRSGVLPKRIHVNAISDWISIIGAIAKTSSQEITVFLAGEWVDYITIGHDGHSVSIKRCADKKGPFDLGTSVVFKKVKHPAAPGFSDTDAKEYD